MTQQARHRPPTGLLLLATLALSAPGCTSLNLAGLPLTGKLAEESRYKSMDGEFRTAATMSEQSYHSVRQARAEGAIVLEVAGASGRVIPLPANGQTVYVSNLLKQAGIHEEFKFIDATLFRHSSESIGGLPMIVKMTNDGDRVRPETDYALQPGDRLRVQKGTSPALKGFLSTLLGV